MKESMAKYKGIISVVALAFEVSLYAPLESFFLNRDEFWFKLGDLILATIPVFLCLVVLLLILYVFLKNRIREIYSVILAIITLIIYLQGNFLGLKVGVMNGADIAWKDYLPRMVLNLFVWVILLLIGLSIYIKRTRIYRAFLILSGIVFGIQMITVSVLMIQYFETKASADDEIVTFTNKGLYTADSEDNTVVFVLDMFDADYFDRILENEPEWGDILDGFTLYDNYTGTYSTTSYSMAHLYTGNRFYNELPQREWTDSEYNDRIYADGLLESGYNLYYYSTIPGVIPQRISERAQNYYEGKCNVSNGFMLSYNIYKLVAFKWFPDCLKPLLWFDGDEFDALRECKDATVYMSDNARFRDGIKSAKWDKSDEKAVRFIYTVGSHYPYRINRYGEDVHMGEVSSVDCARGVLSIVDEYLDHLRDMGTYDNTSVIITADHGYYWDGTLQSPVMLIKPKGSKGPLRVNNAPVCQVDFAATIMELSGMDDYSEYGESILHVNESSDRQRLFYQYYLQEQVDNGNYRLIEYRIDPSGRDRKDYSLTGNEYMSNGELIDHYKYCKTCNGNSTEICDRDYPRLVHEKAENYPN